MTFARVLVRGLAVEGTSERMVLLLADPGDRLLLPIPLEPAEAKALARLLKRQRAGRPSPHDLLAATVRGLGAQVVRVDLRGLQGAQHKADVILRDGRGRRVRLDARAVDAVSLALLAGAPLRASRAALEAAKLPAQAPAPAPTRRSVDASDVQARARLMAQLADLAPEDLADC